MTTELKNQTELSNEHLSRLPVDTSVLFSNHKGIYNRGIENRQRKLLGKIAFIAPFLDQGEKILQVTTGCSPISIWDLFITGWMVFYLKRCLFVFTDRRIFHIPTKPDLSYRHSIAQIFHADCRRILLKGSKLIIDYTNGKTEKFVGISYKERKMLKTMLRSVTYDGPQNQPPQRTHLCPRCANPLTEGRFSCPTCSLVFKSRAEAKKISIIYPGGGYFYTRHPFLGIGDALAEVYLTLLVIMALVGVMTGACGAFIVLFFLTIILGLEKAITVYHSNHFVNEYIPVLRDIRLNPEPQTQRPPAPAQNAKQPKPEDVLSAAWRSM